MARKSAPAKTYIADTPRNTASKDNTACNTFFVKSINNAEATVSVAKK